MLKTILVVDDEPAIVKVVSFRLKKAGYNVVSAADGQEGLDLIGKIKPDLILLDLRLPVLDGFQVCQKVKADESLKSIPIIIFTASSTGENIDSRYKEVGADDYLIKPFEPEVLLEKIRKLLG